MKSSSNQIEQSDCLQVAGTFNRRTKGRGEGRSQGGSRDAEVMKIRLRSKNLLKF